MNLAVFEDAGCEKLLPLTWLRAAFELRCGRDTLLDKMRAHIAPKLGRVLVRPLLREVMAERYRLGEPDPHAAWCLVNARLLAAGDAVPPELGSAWMIKGQLAAATISWLDLAELDESLFTDTKRLADWVGGFRSVPAPAGYRLIEYPWDLILHNASELNRQLREGGHHEGKLYSGVHLLNSSAIHIARDAVVKPGVVLDAEDGPIHIDRGAQIQPNSVIEGPAYIGPRSIVRPCSSIRPGTTIGPICKVGGEIEGSVLYGYSNKQHDGFLGHSYVGAWVNLGADTVTSDLKNTYGAIRVLLNGVGVESGQHFLGAMIGDHAKTGICTILPTGSVLGVAANVFTQSAIPRFVPSFAWLTERGLTRNRVEKAIDIARIVMGRRNVELTAAEERLLAACAAQAAEVEAPGWTNQVTGL